MHPVSARIPEPLAALEGIAQLREAVLSICVNAVWDHRPKGDWVVVPPSKARLPQGTKGRNLLTIRPRKNTFGLVILNKGSELEKRFPRYDQAKIESYKRRLREVIRNIAPGDENTAALYAPKKTATHQSVSKPQTDLPVRIVPMSPGDSDDCSIEEQQNGYFLGDLPGKLKGTYYCRSTLVAEPATPVLFQYRNHVIAFARFLRAETLPKPNKDGYPKIMLFEPASIRVFTPVTADEMRSIWPGEFKKFTHTKPALSPEQLDAFLALVESTTRMPRLVEKSRIESAGGWIGPTKSYIKSGSASAEVSADHNKMQTKLRDELVKKHGSANVKTEQDRVDIRVTTPDEDILFEVKPDESPLSVIRQALGQLLEYAYHPSRSSKRPIRLVIVGRNAPNKTERAYLKTLHSNFGLPVEYRTVSI